MKEGEADEIKKEDPTAEDEVLLNLQELLMMDSEKPEITLLVNGKPITFLCDTGACRTTCKETIPNARPSNQIVVVRSANGKLTKASESEPIWFRDPQGESCQLAVLLLPECPVNLLGRDGLLQLGLGLVPNSQGQIVVNRRAELTEMGVHVIQGTGEPNYYYTLDISNKPPHQTGNALLKEGREVISKVQDQMSEEELHVTLWFKQTPGPDRDYEAKLSKVTPVKITVTYLYAEQGSTAAAAVALPESLEKLHRGGGKPPHVSLYKRKGEEWEDLRENGATGRGSHRLGAYIHEHLGQLFHRPDQEGIVLVRPSAGRNSFTTKTCMRHTVNRR